MKSRFATLSAALLLSSAVVTAADAAGIAYTFTGQYQGSLNGIDFDAPAVVTALGDTTTLTTNGFSNIVALKSVTATAGGVTYRITSPARFYVNQNGYAGLDFFGNGFFSGSNAALLGYDGISDFATAGIVYGADSGVGVGTNMGALIVDSASNGSFSATITSVPEPATWALMILGFGAIGGAMRRRTATTATVRFA